MRIENFKGFVGEHELVLAPINLLYGANSAGKTAILESLLLLNQSVSQPGSNSTGAVEPLLFAGGNVDLGGFKAAVNGHNSSKPIRLGASYIPRRNSNDEVHHFDVSVSWDHTRGNPILDSCIYGAKSAPDGTVTFKRKNRGDGQNAIVPIDDVGFRNVAQGVAERVERYVQPGKQLGIAVQELTPQLMLEADYQNWSFLPGIKINTRNDVIDSATRTDDELRNEFIRDSILRDWRGMIETRYMDTRRKLKSIRHLGPLRQAPSRIEVLMEQQTKYVGVTGKGVASILFRSQETLTKVNEYLANLGIPYELHPRKWDVDSSGTSGEIIALQLIDKRTNVILSLEDVGFGVSQILPLLVQLAMSVDDVIIIEQPELHLHPALQANFADLLIDGIGESKKNQFIVETHSEHMLLRLQRRIRSGTLNPSDVNIFYVDSSEQYGSYIQTLSMDETGEFISPWPKGFFPERLDEILG